MRYILILISVLCVKQAADSYKLIKRIGKQKDMSERCRRRVVPSVFLGRQVADSSAEVLHFSRLEMPYSCSISIRTESGSNIILLVQLNSDKSLIESCKTYPQQLLIYEIGETFGGYWAAISKSMFRQERNKGRNTTFYTLKTTDPTESLKDGFKEGNTSYTKNSMSLTTPQEPEGNYVVMEVPLVNVSGSMELANSELVPTDVDELFDLIYDVSPKNGVLYQTTLMPLVQFSIWKTGQQRDEQGNLDPRYQLDYNIRGFTPDYRLLYRTNNYRRTFSNRPYYSTRRLSYKKKSKRLFAVNNNNRANHKYKVTSNTRFKFYSGPQYITKSLTTVLFNKTQDFTTYENYTDDWQQLESYLKSLDFKNSTNAPKESVDGESFTLIVKNKEIVNESGLHLSKYNSSTTWLTEMKHSSAISEAQHHLFSTFPISYRDNSLHKHTVTMNKVSTSINTESDYTLKAITELPQSTSNKSTITVTKAPTENTKLNIIITRSNSFTEELMTKTVNVYSDLETIDSNSSISKIDSLSENHTTKSLKENIRKPEVGSLVDHESWENVVQVAPVIAGLLNVTPFENDTTFITSNSIYKSTTEEMMKRKKRYIQALPIGQNRPRQITIEEDGFTTRGPSELKFDSQDLAEAVELQDDEVQGRVALRYFGSYVGPAIFNICDFEEAKTRHVYLLNSSRVIISINNFMMESMTIVLTESQVARTSGCPPAHLECQVSGVRVCVHHINACDGVPNCGSYDIYDEDRLLCGGNVGFQYTIVIAACTFLVVVLTVLYSVHYWLRRCVPKVSQAFFVYADKSENILYLDSIMRSPMDFDESSKLVYQSSFFEDDILSTGSTKEDKNKILSVITACFHFLLCTKPKRNVSKEIAQQDLSHSLASDVKRKFSFTEQELRNFTPIGIDASIQTGNSLEMAYMKQLRTSSFVKRRSHDQHDQDWHKMTGNHKEKSYSPQQSANELKTLRRIRDMAASLQSCTGTLEMSRKFSSVGAEEIELQSTEYDRPGKSAPSTRDTLIRTSCEIHSEPKGTTPKHLRFKELATTIPSSEDEDEEDKVDGSKVVLRADRHANLDSIEENEEAGSSTGRDFMRFWGGGKTKKSKKKTRVSLRNN